MYQDREERREGQRLRGRVGWTGRHLWPRAKAGKLEGSREGRSGNEELMSEEHRGLKDPHGCGKMEHTQHSRLEHWVELISSMLEAQQHL